MNILTMLRRKRDGEALSQEEWRFLLNGYEKEIVPDSQMAALLMASYLRGMSPGEIQEVAEHLRPPSSVDQPAPPKEPRVGFRALGGHADKLTLLLGPILASAGYASPVTFTTTSIQRVVGLLESNPTIELRPSPKRLEQLLTTVGTAFFVEGGSGRLRKLQEETATGESASWAVARVLAERLCQGIVFGLGERSKDSALAENLVALGRSAGLSASVFVVDWSVPTGRASGAALAMNECVSFLRRGPQDSPVEERLHELTLEFAMEMACVSESLKGKKRPSAPAMREILTEAITSGKAYAKFLEIVSLTGGDTEALDEGLPLAPKVMPLLAPTSGFLAAVGGIAPALATLTGGGKPHPGVGFSWEKSVGDSVRKGETIAQIYAKDKKSADQASELLLQAVLIAPEALPKPKLILRRI